MTDELQFPPLPELPYAGTSGWSGSQTSRARAEREDRDGTTSWRQRAVLEHLRRVGAPGATWNELADYHGWHHGQASGVLSVLHKTGRIARLTERRGRSLVYVSLEHVGDRTTSAAGSTRRQVGIPDGMVALVLPVEVVERLSIAPGSLLFDDADLDAIRSAARTAIGNE